MQMVDILIPTFNRKEKLIRTLNMLECQKYDNFNIIISDNHSDYDINTVLAGLKPEFVNRIRIHQNAINVGVDNNILVLLSLASSDWIWFLADDDYIEEDATERILSAINKYTDCAIIDFPVHDISAIAINDFVTNDIKKYIEFHEKYAKSNGGAFGNLVFLSNKLYNRDKLKDIFSYMFQYNYTKISTAVVIFKALDENLKVATLNQRIVIHDGSEGIAWNVRKVFTGVRTFADIDFKCEYKYKKRIYLLLSHGYRFIIKTAFIEPYRKKDMFLSNVYHDYYRHFLNMRDKIMFNIFIGMAKTRIGHKIMNKIFTK